MLKLSELKEKLTHKPQKIQEPGHLEEIVVGRNKLLVRCYCNIAAQQISTQIVGIYIDLSFALFMGWSLAGMALFQATAKFRCAVHASSFSLGQWLPGACLFGTEAGRASQATGSKGLSTPVMPSNIPLAGEREGKMRR